MNIKLNEIYKHLSEEYSAEKIEPYRSEPQRKEGFIVIISSQKRLIYTFSDECLQDHNEAVLLDAMVTTMKKLAEQNPDTEVLLSKNLSAELKVFE